jgi:hypothetical protein
MSVENMHNLPRLTDRFAQDTEQGAAKVALFPPLLGGMGK